VRPSQPDMETPAGAHRLEVSHEVPGTPERVFDFFGDARNLEAITPPFLRFRILTPLPIEMRAGTRIDYALSLFGVPVRWTTRITAWEPGVRFVDEQESGPYALWRHTHLFEARGERTLVRDVVHYREPLGPLGRLAHHLFVRRTLVRIFDFRRGAISRLLAPSGPGGRVSETAPAPALEVFFDGACPFCAREVRFLRRLDRRRQVLFTDISEPGFSPDRAGVPWDALMARIHARPADGTLVQGVEVFRRIYALLGFGPLVAVTRLPGLSHLLDAAYAWFARNRMRLAGRCEDGSCGRTGHGADAGRQGAPSREAECRLHTRPAAWGRDEERREGGRNDVSVGLRSA